MLFFLFHTRKVYTKIILGIIVKFFNWDSIDYFDTFGWVDKPFAGITTIEYGLVVVYGLWKQLQLFVYVLIGAGALSMTVSENRKGFRCFTERIAAIRKTVNGTKMGMTVGLFLLRPNFNVVELHKNEDFVHNKI